MTVSFCLDSTISTSSCWRSNSNNSSRLVSSHRQLPVAPRGWAPSGARTHTSHRSVFIHTVKTVCRSRWRPNYLRPGAGVGAKIIFFMNIYCSQFGGCKNEEKLIHTSIGMILLLYNSFKRQYKTGAGAEIRDKGGAGVRAENK